MDRLYLNLTSNNTETYERNTTIPIQVYELENQVDDGFIQFQVEHKYSVNYVDENNKTSVKTFEPGKSYYADMTQIAIVAKYEFEKTDAAKAFLNKHPDPEPEDDDKYLDEQMLDAWDACNY